MEIGKTFFQKGFCTLFHTRKHEKQARKGMKMAVGEVGRLFLEVDGMLTEVLTVAAAAYRYNFSIRTIQKWCDEGKLIAHKFEGIWWIPLPAIEQYVKTKDFYHRYMGQYE